MKKLFDNHGREINYLRLAVTDRCNLRCFYCMPEEGIKYVPQSDLLSYEEMLRICSLLAKMGIKKVRITGGEPFVRRNLEYFIRELNKIPGIEQIHLTTNGTVTPHLIPHFREMGIKSVNLSLDTLDRDRFFQITRRDGFPKVMQSLEALIDSGIKTKINAVVMDGKNTEDILPMVEMTRYKPISVRFIEEMPFNGEGVKYPQLNWNYKQIIEHIKSAYPTLEKLPDPPFSTSYNYTVPGFAGSVGVIAAYTRTFCGSCNRIRLTPKGVLKTCLYDDGVFNLKTFIREGASDKQLEDLFLNALGNRAKDGYEAEKRRNFGLPITESMSTIGG
ncbi:MAG: GTP 3',8-cyclase MoaA [Bacteroidota bacterium]